MTRRDLERLLRWAGWSRHEAVVEASRLTAEDLEAISALC